jgi:hypothetical protein
MVLMIWLVGWLRQMIPRVGAAFLEGFVAVDAQAYSVYCANRKHAHALYAEKSKSSAAFAACIKRSEALPVVEKLSLADFLAKPMQRLTKYPLLLKGIQSNTSATDLIEQMELTTAIEKAESVLRYVQEAIRESEDQRWAGGEFDFFFLRVNFCCCC